MATIRDVFVELNSEIQEYKEYFGQEFVERVQSRTPVRTGFLRDSWGYTVLSQDIEIYNDAEYASFVEYGTDRMAPRGMMRATMLEVQDISDVAAERAGLL